MSRKPYYLQRAYEADALAQSVKDPLSRQTIDQAAAAWRLLAGLEDDPPPRPAGRGTARSGESRAGAVEGPPDKRP